MVNTIETFVRVKPTGAKNKSAVSAAFTASDTTLQFANNGGELLTSEHSFKFSYVFLDHAIQKDVFEQSSEGVVKGFWNGYNGTIFAYGQTGSGKTHTMEGRLESTHSQGVAPRALTRTFELWNRSTGRSQISLKLSYVEIYQETGYDLLADPRDSMRRNFPKVHFESGQGHCIIRGLSAHAVETVDDALRLIARGKFNSQYLTNQLTNKSAANRRRADTHSNKHSSRSHAVIIVELSFKDCRETIIQSKLHLVDLAGSERYIKTKSSGNAQRLSETKSINLSLHHLETVIIAIHKQSVQTERCRSAQHRRRRSITEFDRSSFTRPFSAVTPYGRVEYIPNTQHRHIPFRNSLLTVLLRDSLGGNCRTVLIVTISQLSEHLQETLSTCRFAQRVACIRNNARRNERIDDKALIRSLKKRISELEREVAELKSSGDGETRSHSKIERSSSMNSLVMPCEMKPTAVPDVEPPKPREAWKENGISKKERSTLSKSVPPVKSDRDQRAHQKNSKGSLLSAERMNDVVRTGAPDHRPAASIESVPDQEPVRTDRDLSAPSRLFRPVNFVISVPNALNDETKMSNDVIKPSPLVPNAVAEARKKYAKLSDRRKHERCASDPREPQIEGKTRGASETAISRTFRNSGRALTSREIGTLMQSKDISELSHLHQHLMNRALLLRKKLIGQQNYLASLVDRRAAKEILKKERKMESLLLHKKEKYEHHIRAVRQRIRIVRSGADPDLLQHFLYQSSLLSHAQAQHHGSSCLSPRRQAPATPVTPVEFATKKAPPPDVSRTPREIYETVSEKERTTRKKLRELRESLEHSTLLDNDPPPPSASESTRMEREHVSSERQASRHKTSPKASTWRFTQPENGVAVVTEHFEPFPFSPTAAIVPFEPVVSPPAYNGAHIVQSTTEDGRSRAATSTTHASFRTLSSFSNSTGTSGYRSGSHTSSYDVQSFSSEGAVDAGARPAWIQAGFAHVEPHSRTTRFQSATDNQSTLSHGTTNAFDYNHLLGTIERNLPEDRQSLGSAKVRMQESVHRGMNSRPATAASHKSVSWADSHGHDDFGDCDVSGSHTGDGVSILMRADVTTEDKTKVASSSEFNRSPRNGTVLDRSEPHQRTKPTPGPLTAGGARPHHHRSARQTLSPTKPSPRGHFIARKHSGGAVSSDAKYTDFCAPISESSVVDYKAARRTLQSHQSRAETIRKMHSSASTIQRAWRSHQSKSVPVPCRR